MKKCKTRACEGRALKKRTTLPWTAVKGGDKWFDFYQCPKCKTNYAFEKGADREAGRDDV